MNDQELELAQRQHALSEAIKSRTESENTGVTITRARKYFEFLSGDASKTN